MKNQGGRAPARSVRCYNCGELGHFSHDCTPVKGPISMTTKKQKRKRRWATAAAGSSCKN